MPPGKTRDTAQKPPADNGGNSPDTANGKKPTQKKIRETLFLIDGTAYIHRAYHAVRGLSNSGGLPTNAAFGFTKMLVKLMEEKQPVHAVMVFDARGPTFRHEIYPEYKANRKAMEDDMAVQIPWIKKITKGFGLPILEMQGFEADDLIGTIAKQAEKEGFSVVMVTGDKDLMQLVTENTRMWDPMKEKTLDISSIQQQFGIRPEQLTDVMGFSGDASDNVPGVPGIGDKTARTLVQEFGSMEGVYENIDSITKQKQKESLIQNRDQAFLSKELVTIKTDIDLSFQKEDFRIREKDMKALSAIFRELEFRQLQKDYPGQVDHSGKTYLPVTGEKEFAGLVEKLNHYDTFSLDTETTSRYPMHADIVGISISFVPEEAWYIPVGHEKKVAEKQLDKEYVLNTLQPLLEDSGKKKIGQNIKYDAIIFQKQGIAIKGIFFDTMVASYLLNPSKRAHSLDQIALDFLDYTKVTYDQTLAVKKGEKKISHFGEVPLEKATPYACEDADITFAAYRVLEPMLKKEGLDSLMQEVEIPLIPVLAGMETKGICVNREKLETLSHTFSKRLETLEKEIYALAGEEFNINSPSQLGEILFEKLGLPTQKKTKKKTGYSTDVEVLTFLAQKHELPRKILEQRSIAKLKSTYTDALVELIHPETGRVHTSFNQTITATGRLSSSDPNLQNIPVRGEGLDIRRAFIPQKGWKLVCADYSQIELRILAHYAKDKLLTEAFEKDEDIHAQTAREVFGVLPEMIDAELRRQAKAINFGIIYGMSPFGLSRELSISQKMAKTYIDHYFKRYQGVRRFLDETMETARKTGKIQTLLGRIRHIPEINSKNANTRKNAERTAVNTPIQGTAADFIKLAMIRADRAIKEHKMRSSMLLTVHDELVFESPPEEVDDLVKMVVQAMENVYEMEVPVRVNVGIGDNWADAHP